MLRAIALWRANGIVLLAKAVRPVPSALPVAGSKMTLL
jgi:hypothetical protein